MLYSCFCLYILLLLSPLLRPAYMDTPIRLYGRRAFCGGLGVSLLLLPVAAVAAAVAVAVAGGLAPSACCPLQRRRALAAPLHWPPC